MSVYPQGGYGGHITLRCASNNARLDDKYLPSYLARGECEGRVFHVQIAADVEGKNIRIVTMYLPAAEEWDSEFRVRRVQK